MPKGYVAAKKPFRQHRPAILSTQTMIEEIRIKIKPLSVNDAWQGKRFKTDKYTAYETEMLVRLPAGKLPEPPYRVYYEFGLSRRDADYDNPVKPTQDILQKKYRFDDKEIYEAHIRKVLVKKGHEYVPSQLQYH